MIHTYTYKDVTWIDLESPTKEEVLKIIEEQNISVKTAEEFLSPTVKPRFEFDNDSLFLILHFPTLRQKKGIPLNQEIDFFLQKNLIITTHYDAIDPLHKFSRIFEVSTILDKGHLGENAGYVFYFMLKRIYESLIVELEFMDEALRDIETRIFEEKEREMVLDISKTGRNLLDFKRSTLHHREILEQLKSASINLYGKEYSYHVEDLINEYSKISEMTKAQSELLSELRSTNNSLLNTKQNETMKTFTVLAFVTFPLSLLLSLLTVNTPSNPLLGMPNDYPIILGTIFFGAIFMYLMFKYKKWL